MRLIDADDLINNLVNACNNDQSKTFPVWIEKQIDAQPTILNEQDSVIEVLKSDLDETLAVLSEKPEIVRCRECKYGCLMASGKVYMCESPEQNKKICVHVHKPDWFCADGEKKEVK